ncbi:MAG: hypothetical protein R3B58_03660 [Phycisphaerales bacterium]
MRKFKHLRRKLRIFIVRAIQHIKLQLDRCEPVSKLCVLVRECVLVHIVAESEIEQSVLLLDEQRSLALEFGSLSARIILRIACL